MFILLIASEMLTIDSDSVLAIIMPEIGVNFRQASILHSYIIGLSLATELRNVIYNINTDDWEPINQNSPYRRASCTINHWTLDQKSVYPGVSSATTTTARASYISSIGTTSCSCSLNWSHDELSRWTIISNPPVDLSSRHNYHYDDACHVYQPNMQLYKLFTLRWTACQDELIVHTESFFSKPPVLRICVAQTQIIGQSLWPWTLIAKFINFMHY